MQLHLNTALHDHITVSLSLRGTLLAEWCFKASRQQAEKLLPAIKTLLVKAGADLRDIEKIIVENRGAGFTSLRIGVITANALGYALGVPVEPAIGRSHSKTKGFSVVKPLYDRPPSVTIKRTL